MAWYWLALMLICGIYLTLGVVMLVIYITLEHKTYKIRSKFNPYVSMPVWDWYEIPLFIVIWPWALGVLGEEVTEYYHARGYLSRY